MTIYTPRPTPKRSKRRRPNRCLVGQPARRSWLEGSIDAALLNGV
jgi:hypothetical protein